MFHSFGETTISVKIKNKLSFKWSISNFSFCSDTTGDFIQSSVFPLEKSDEKWCLRIYPGGVKAKSATCKSISLFLVLVSSNQKAVKATFQLSIMNANNEKVIGKTFNQPQKFVPGEERGYDVINRNNLFNKSNGLLENDVITISCEVTCFDYNMEPKEVSLPTQYGLNPNQIDPDISKHFEDLFENQRLTDITFCIKGQELKAHRTILASRSVVFRAMFETDMKETATNIIEITDIEYNVFKAMLHFIYTDKAPNPEMAKELLPAADKYNLDRLKALCEKDIFTNLTAENSAEVLILADLHNCSHLKSLILEFIVANVRIVMETVGWRSLEKTHPVLIAEALKELCKSRFNI